MEDRAAKLALARKKLKDHQEKKTQDNAGKNVHLNNSSSTGSPSLLQTNNDVKVEPNKNEVENIIEIPQTQVTLEESNTIDVNAAEILISNKRNLELQNIELQNKLIKVEKDLASTIYHYKDACQKIESLEYELQNTKQTLEGAAHHLLSKDAIIADLNKSTASVQEENKYLKEQLEFTKSILTGKEAENSSLNTQVINIQSELDSMTLQLQQLTSGIQQTEAQQKPSIDEIKHENEILLQKVSSLEHQLKIQIRDYQQINVHYENYVEELNNQIKALTKKNEELSRELHNLSARETSLIDQISDMEIRLQNYNKVTVAVTETNNDTSEIQAKLTSALDQLQTLQKNYEELQKLYSESLASIEELKQTKPAECEHTEVTDLLKLNAEITSDKVAVQRATEQNKKLKQDVQGLEEAFVKMSKDKLELTEKITAEKFLNRELTIKLGDLDEKTKDMHNKLKAKDVEMIRLQASYREMEKKYEQLENHINNYKMSSENTISNPQTESNISKVQSSTDEASSPLIECTHLKENIPKDDAMQKLQDRFLKIMGEVADLSDEKHRLEHIITQLQNETETICEYVALYQQQRSLLKKRDEERSAQIKIFQSECKRLQEHLEDLTYILTRFSKDPELVAYFQIPAKREDIQKVMFLLSNLKSNILLDPHKTLEFNSFYPCNCCSGQLIEV